MGLPGFSGFVAELQVLTGAWHAFPTLTVVTGIGILLGVAYTLRVLQNAFFAGPPLAPASAPPNGAGHAVAWDPISVPERIGAAILIGTTLTIGLFPGLLLNLIVPTLNPSHFHFLAAAGGP
jgi:NADH-quinone oxidoreductase subunit M